MRFETSIRRMIATTAAKRYGTEPVEPDTLVVREVYDALRQPSVLLGLGACPTCGDELDINERCSRGCLDSLDCEPDQPRQYRTFAQKWGRR
jgi:hypothetical protein